MARTKQTGRKKTDGKSKLLYIYVIKFWEVYLKTILIKLMGDNRYSCLLKTPEIGLLVEM